jgi:hypothetical protein
MNQGISFCTTCHNRLWQLKQTLASNLTAIGPDMEVVLIDYASRDGLSDWVWAQFEADITAGRLVFFSVTSPVRWHASKAKNLAHRLARRDYLFNLDADNFLDAEDLIYISPMAEVGATIHQWSGEWGDGSYGRIGLPRTLFFKLGGYDEALLPMGGQDLDLLRRSEAAGFPATRLTPPARPPIENNKVQKIAALTKKSVDAGEYFEQMNQANFRVSRFKLAHEGPARVGGFASFDGLLNGEPMSIDGFDRIQMTR